MNTTRLPAIIQAPMAGVSTPELAAAAVACGDHEFDACWAGQGAALTRPMPAAALVDTLYAESRLI
ncbi:hypothetical protein [Kushneria aurantia]|uniref:2-nitropropane dioxygenase n=1 Tax=Kushneria aurantia TaxID=504092 RepID=A0ABV6G2Q4_9GAMM|nr:hypothetical protein [Kushneria aurantia]